MTMQKFITIDLQTGKKVLQTIEASFIKLSNPQDFSNATNLEEALKSEITRALADEKVLTDKLAEEVARAKSVEEAIKAVIGDLGEDVSVKEEIDRIDDLITTLTSTVDQHSENTDIHITTEERSKWDEAVETLKSKADKDETTQELDKKVNKTDLFDNDKIKTDLLPSIAINDVRTVATVVEAMGLVVENGDVVIINPDAKTPKTNKAVTGTFICVDATKDSFDEKFRQLYSNTDYISKADVDNLIRIEKERAEKVETELAKDITVINGGEDDAGSIQHAVKLEKERAVAEESALSTRITESKAIIDQLAGSKSTQGSAAYLADVALTDAKAHTNEEITKVKSDATALSSKVQTLESTVGNATTGLVKDVTDLKSDVTTIKGDEQTEGSIAKALDDAKKHADKKVDDEKVTREAEDKKLSDRIKALEASEEFKVNLGFEGAAVSDVLAIRADGKIVKATLKDSSVVGIVVDANGANSKTAVMGRVDGFRDLVPGTSYFLGEDGRITATIPTQVGQNIIKVGVALTTTELFVNIQEAIEIRK